MDRIRISSQISFFVLCLSMVLSGCMRGPIMWQRVTVNQPITPDQITFIQEGKTSLSEVANELGTPDEIVIDSDESGRLLLKELRSTRGARGGVVRNQDRPTIRNQVKKRLVARYHFSDSKYLRIDFGWGLRFVIPFYSPEMLLGGGGSATDVFEVACDSQLVVQETSFAFRQSFSQFKLWPFGD